MRVQKARLARRHLPANLLVARFTAGGAPEQFPHEVPVVLPPFFRVAPAAGDILAHDCVFDRVLQRRLPVGRHARKRHHSQVPGADPVLELRQIASPQGIQGHIASEPVDNLPIPRRKDTADDDLVRLEGDAPAVRLHRTPPAVRLAQFQRLAGVRVDDPGRPAEAIVEPRQRHAAWAGDVGPPAHRRRGKILPRIRRPQVLFLLVEGVDLAGGRTGALLHDHALPGGGHEGPGHERVRGQRHRR